MPCGKNPNMGRLVYDTYQTEVNNRIFTDFAKDQWNNLYPDAEELLPPKMPKPRRSSVKSSTYVDADHNSTLETWRYHTGILIYLDNLLIIWFSKQQNKRKYSIFGFEFVALRIATELPVSLRYKHRMYGFPMYGPADAFCDNQSMMNIAILPHSVLNKRHIAICYQKFCKV